MPSESGGTWFEHMFELNQLPWPLAVELILSVPAKTPICRHQVGQSFMRQLTRNLAQCKKHSNGDNVYYQPLSWGEDRMKGRRLVLHPSVRRVLSRSAGCSGPGSPWSMKACVSLAEFYGLPLCPFSLTLNSHHLRTSGLAFSMHIKELNIRLGVW